ncbi:MAG: AlpA family phage regulatory protein [Candidimonas sp.]|nr:MAG: AlpA family phage regulatory protein [Candidimonas sp.]TAM22303.1 MAG: AlpA family phage regulatory protein [Candidimonas sp.]TAM80191.1 MAG: AlpA family phage regulatory protein [Candidimonas sp.]
MSNAPTTNKTTQNDDRLVTDREVAQLLSCSRSWPWKLSSEGKFPKPIRLSARCTRWSRLSVLAWMADPQAWQAAHGGK